MKRRAGDGSYRFWCAGIKLRGDDSVVGMGSFLQGVQKPGEKELLVVMENGYGKRSDLIEYKVQGRGGSGIKTANINKKQAESFPPMSFPQTMNGISL